MSVSLNGTTQSLVTSGGNVLRNASGGTLMLWMKANSLPGGGAYLYQVETNSGNNSRSALVFNYSGGSGSLSLLARVNDSNSLTDITSTSTVSTGTWVHFAGTFNYAAATGIIYINGSAVSTTGSFSFNASATDNTTSARSSIGAADAGSDKFFNGSLEDIRCYSRILTANEILTIYSSAGRDGIVDGLNQRLQFLGPAGTVVGSEFDLSDFKLNVATINASPTWQDSRF
jgi:hypothetical protein